MTMRSHYDEIQPFITKDGSIIRELMHPAHGAARKQSLAEAIVPPGACTVLHRHAVAEEIYYFTAGEGKMILGDESFTVKAGDTVVIPPGTPHNLQNCGDQPLVLLCCCTPAYADGDTELLQIP